MIIDVNLLSDLVNSIDTIQYIYYEEFWRSSFETIQKFYILESF